MHASLVFALYLATSAHAGSWEYLPSLADAAKKHGLLLGAMTNVNHLRSEHAYKTLEQEQFAITTAENSCKVGPIHPQPDVYNFKDCDTVFDTANAAGQKVRGHNLCWHSQNPPWLNSSLSHDKLVSALGSHIDTVVKHYGTKAYAWDVVNEAVSDGGSGVPTIKTEYPPWMPTVPDFIDRAFHFARQAGGPQVKLFYNDYGAVSMNPKADRMYELVKGLLQRKVPIDGVGFQFHINHNMSFLMPSIESNLKRFAALGLEVQITELDIRACDEWSTCDAAALQNQADMYADLLEICLGIPQCKVFEMWGFTDKYTWLDDFQNPTHKDEMPLPFDKDYAPKPAYHSMMQVLLNSSTAEV